MTELRLPPRDRKMFAIMMGLMILAAFSAYASGHVWKIWPLYIVMPGTLLVIRGCYSASLFWASRMKHATDEAMDAMGAFMGRTLSLAGGIMAVAQLCLLGFASGLLKDFGSGAFLRLFMVALSVMLILLHNRMPKFLMSHTPAGMARWHLRASWLGVACGVVMIIIAMTLPIGEMTLPFLTFALIPTVAHVAGAVIWRMRQGKAG